MAFPHRVFFTDGIWVVSSVQSISFISSGVPLASENARPDAAANAVAQPVPEFLFGPENELLDIAVKPLVRSGECRFRPLVLVGPSGVGKSHLASGIAFSTAGIGAVLRFAAVDFARQATEAKDPVESAQRFRALHGAEVLILEDVHRLVGKHAAQTMLTTLLDDLVSRGATVIVTSNCPPAKLSSFGSALIDRLSSGLVISLAPPSPAVRRAMITHIADREQLKISAGAADRLAEAPFASWRDLRGALLQLRFGSGRRSAAIRLPDVRRFLAEKPAPGAPEIRDIASAVAKHYGLRLRDLQSASRRRGVVDARNITAYLARKSTGQSLQQIGCYLGNRDHTTILHGIRKIDQQIAKDPALQQLVNDLLLSLMPQSHDDRGISCRAAVDHLSIHDDF